MPDTNQDVNPQPDPSPADQPVNQQTDAPETEVPAEESASQEPEQVTQGVPPEQEGVDERGVPWRNRAMEAVRRLSETPIIVRQTVEETLRTHQAQPAQREYTIEELETFAAEQPKYRPWVESEKAKIIQRNLEKSIDVKLQATRRESEETMIRQQSEQWVVNHPEFKSCFRKDVTGNQVWDFTNPLTQAMGAILNSPDPLTDKLVKDRPDGLRVAAEMAYGRLALANKGKVTTQVSQLRRDLRKTQARTMVTGGNGQAVTTTTTTNPVQKNLQEYGRTYNKQFIRDATREHLKSRGLIKEE